MITVNDVPLKEYLDKEKSIEIQEERRRGERRIAYPHLRFSKERRVKPSVRSGRVKVFTPEQLERENVRRFALLFTYLLSWGDEI
jgi:hypothetical protein